MYHTQGMKILYIETFYTGSHRYFADQWISRSEHSITLITMPGRFWKWRQAGAAMYLAEILPVNLRRDYDTAVVSGMIDLAHLKTLRPDLPPVMLYLHENQFDYPAGPEEEKDYRYGITDVINALAAETTVFNSIYNRDTLLNSCSDLFRRLPDAMPRNVPDKIYKKSRIIYPGIDTEYFYQEDQTRTGQALKPAPPLVIWNHRHEHDKNPDLVFGVLERLKNRKIDFRLALLGERFKRTPPAFDRARKLLADRIVIDDFPSRELYCRWLRQGDIIISTAHQENFGIAVIEAACAGCWPLLPRRLSYPEVMPRWVSEACFHNDETDLEERLTEVISLSRIQRNALTGPLSRWLKRYDWKSQAAELDRAAEETLYVRGVS